MNLREEINEWQTQINLKNKEIDRPNIVVVEAGVK